MLNKTQTYSAALYAHMAENAETRTIEDKQITVWSGSITRTCNKLGIPKGTERRVMAPLERMGCLQILARGAAKYPSVVALFYPPTAETWASDDGKGLTSRATLASLSREVEDIKRRLGGANLAEALLNLDHRLTVLEQKAAIKS